MRRCCSCYLCVCGMIITCLIERGKRRSAGTGPTAVIVRAGSRARGSTSAVAPPAAHLRFSSAYAWNASTLSATWLNLAQAASVDGAAALARRGLPSALAALQGPVFVRTSASDHRLAPDWEAQLDRLASRMQPWVRPGAIEAVSVAGVCRRKPRARAQGPA